MSIFYYFSEFSCCTSCIWEEGNGKLVNGLVHLPISTYKMRQCGVPVLHVELLLLAVVTKTSILLAAAHWSCPSLLLCFHSVHWTEDWPVPTGQLSWSVILSKNWSHACQRLSEKPNDVDARTNSICIQLALWQCICQAHSIGKGN